MRLGLIGSTGHWQTYAPALRHVPGLELVATSSRSAAAATASRPGPSPASNAACP
jgi:predicted dehydrogenase